MTEGVSGSWIRDRHLSGTNAPRHFATASSPSAKPQSLNCLRYERTWMSRACPVSSYPMPPPPSKLLEFRPRHFSPYRQHHAAGAVPPVFSLDVRPSVTCRTDDSAPARDGARSSAGRHNASLPEPSRVAPACNSGSDSSHRSVCLDRRGTSPAASERIASILRNQDKAWRLPDHRGGDGNKCASCTPVCRVRASACQ